MAITQALCSSYKVEEKQGIHDLTTDVIKMALYTSSATLGAATTTYSATNEVSAVGYTATGKVMTGGAVTLDGTTAIVDFDDVVWLASTITARGALIYNSSKANRSVAVIDFGSDRSSTAESFTVVMPAPTASTALIRSA